MRGGGVQRQSQVFHFLPRLLHRFFAGGTYLLEFFLHLRFGFGLAARFRLYLFQFSLNFFHRCPLTFFIQPLQLFGLMLFTL